MPNPQWPTIRADLPCGKLQRACLPVRPTHRNRARFGARCPHRHGRQVARACDFAALNLAGLCEVVPYEHDLAWAGDSTFLPKRGRRLPGVGWHWHGGEGRVAWGQPREVLSVLDLDEHCAYPVHGGLQEASRAHRSVRRARSPRAAVTKMPALLDEALAVGHRPDIRVLCRRRRSQAWGPACGRPYLGTWRASAFPNRGPASRSYSGAGSWNAPSGDVPADFNYVQLSVLELPCARIARVEVDQRL